MCSERWDKTWGLFDLNTDSYWKDEILTLLWFRLGNPFWLRKNQNICFLKQHLTHTFLTTWHCCCHCLAKVLGIPSVYETLEGSVLNCALCTGVSCSLFWDMLSYVFILGHAELCRMCMIMEGKVCSRILSKTTLLYITGGRSTKVCFLSHSLQFTKWRKESADIVYL